MRARISEDEPAETALAKLTAVVEEFVTDPEERAFVEPRLQQLLGLERPRRARPRGSVLRLAVVLRAHVGAGPRRPDLRGHPVGRHRARRVRRVPARVVAEHADLRDHARPAGAGRPPPGLGRELAQLHARSSSSRSPARRSTRCSPGSSRACPTRPARRSATAPTASRCTRSRRCACCSTAACSSATGTSTAPVGDDRGARRPRDAAGADRRAARRARPGGAARARRRLRARQDLLASRGLAALSGHGGGGGRRRCSPGSSARRYSRSRPIRGRRSAASTASSRRSSSGSPTRRSRATTGRRSTCARRSTSPSEAGIEPDEIAEVIAAHYLDAFRADESADDAARDRGERTRVARRGRASARPRSRRPRMRGGPSTRRAQLARRPARPRGALESAGTLAERRRRARDRTRAPRRGEAALRGRGPAHDAARAAAGMSRALWNSAGSRRRSSCSSAAFAVLASDEPDADVGALAAESARVHHFSRRTTRRRWSGSSSRSGSRRRRCFPEVLSQALNTKALMLHGSAPHEARALLREALDVALDTISSSAALRAYNNLVVILAQLDRPEETRRMEIEALELAPAPGKPDFRHFVRRISLVETARRRGLGRSVRAGRRMAPDRADRAVGPGVLHEQARLGRARARRRRRGTTPARPARARESTRQPTCSSARSWPTKRMLLAIDDRRIEDVVAAAGETARLDAGMRKLDPDREHRRDRARHAPANRRRLRLLPLIDLADAAPRGRTGTPAGRRHRSHSRRRSVARRGPRPGGRPLRHGALGRPQPRRALWIARVLAAYATALVRAGRADEAEPLAAEAREPFERMGAVRAIERLDAGMPAGVTA